MNIIDKMTRQYEKRYTRIQEKMDMLSITDVSTPRQWKNGTRVWQLPIKLQAAGNHHITGKPFPDRHIQVASFKTGYVRNQNGGYTNYQLNKRCESEPQYYELPNGTYNKYTTRSCVLIPNEIDRLEYLIGYCLKNYYIKNANQVVNGEYVDKWKLENAQNGMVPKWKYDEAMELGKQQDCGHYDRIHDLECAVGVYEDKQAEDRGKIRDLEDKLHVSQEELSATKVRQDVSVIVNGHRYKVL